MAENDVVLAPRVKTTPKDEKPKLYQVLLFNDDYTPREFVVMVLQYVFRADGSSAEKIMLTAHIKGSSVVAVYTKDIAETKVKEAMDLAKEAGFPLMFTSGAGGVIDLILLAEHPLQHVCHRAGRRQVGLVIAGLVDVRLHLR